MARLEALKKEARDRLVNFRNACKAAGLQADGVEAVHYCFCAALDQAGRQIQGICRGVWQLDGLLREHYGSEDTGQQSRTWVLRLMQTPGTGADALAVIGELMARGLRDEHGAPLPSPAPRAAAEVGATAEPAPAVPTAEASPPERRRWRGWRAWIAGGAVVLVLLLAFVAVREFVEQHKLAQARLAVATQWEADRQRIAQQLAEPIAAGGVIVDRRDDGRLHLTFGSALRFAVGKADMPPGLGTELDRVAAALADTDSPITIVGHADDGTADGLSASNLALSALRAETVGHYLEKAGIAHARMTMKGRGADEPAADNRIREGRRLNRRVELFIERRVAGAPA